MTEDARIEVERWLSEWDRWAERKPHLVAALAAAIEETDAETALRSHPLRDHASVELNRRLAMATEDRRAALSALRARVDSNEEMT